MNQGCFGTSSISGKELSGDIPEKIRPYFLKFSFGHFDASKVRKTADYIKETSLYQKLTFLILMYFTHQFLLFSVEAFSFEKLDWIIKKTLISTIISIILCYIFILIFYTKNAR